MNNASYLDKNDVTRLKRLLAENPGDAALIGEGAFIRGEIAKALKDQTQRLKKDITNWRGQWWVWYVTSSMLPVIHELGRLCGSFPPEFSELKDEAKYNAWIGHANKVLQYATPSRSNILAPEYGTIKPEGASLLEDLPSARDINGKFDQLAQMYNDFSKHEVLPVFLFALGSPGDLSHIENIYMFMWFYAASLPHDEGRFAQAVALYQRAAGETFSNKDKHNEDNPVIELLCVDCLLAKIKSVAKMGESSVDGLRNLINEWEDHFIGKKDEEALSNLASGFKWLLKDARYEKELLQKMQAGGVPMGPVLQERLQLLLTIGDDAPALKSVALGDDNTLAFDNESLSWDTRRLSAFFDGLIAQNQILPYALTMEDWIPDAKLRVERGIDWSNDDAYGKIVEEIADQYEEEVSCDRRVLALLKSGKNDTFDGLLLSREVFGHIGLFVHIIKEGRTIEPHVYTLFMPVPEKNGGKMRVMKELAVDLKEIASGQNKDPKITAYIQNVRDAASQALGKAGAKEQGVVY
jgi:hypothetical protein